MHSKKFLSVCGWHLIAMNIPPQKEKEKEKGSDI
jgi:hypothetical protein